MSTVAIRKKLHEFIADADDKKIKGMFLLLEEEITKKENFKLSASHLDILAEEKLNHTNGTSPSYSWDQAKDIIRGNKQPD